MALSPTLTDLSPGDLRRRRSAKWSRYPPDVLPAWIAEMDFPLAPPVTRVLQDAIDAGDCGYADPSKLGVAFAEFAATRHGWELDPARVSPSPDVLGAIAAVLGAIAEPGDRVVVNTPVYHPFFAAIEEAGCELAEAPLVDDELDLEAIERELAGGAVALILCSPHNPAGTVPSREQLAAVAAAAAQHGAWVLADEIHAPLTLPGAAHVPFLTVSDAAARGIAFWSASKAFNLAGLGCAEIVTASPEAAAVVERLPAGATHCGHFGALGSVAAFRGGGPWLDDVLAVVDYNRRLLTDLLGERLPEVVYREPEASYLAWLDFRHLDLGPDPSQPILERGRLALSPGPQFGPQGAGFARLNLGTSPALVEEAVERIAKAVGRAQPSPAPPSSASE
ncbi:MAG TPA: aminotransferase class I/II-fold pyridoxal phosphate-dependent enzyme [Solirubrobacterales bacterium]|nr:aminotransferase class I/II-fold pyridoxal phosphate-dependent enzyme [Solirubrobacterales bacterium]